MTSILVASISGAVGSVAFAVLYHVKPRHLFVALLGGLITTFLMVALADLGNLISNSIAAFIGALFCFVMARYRKAPFTVFMIPSLFPLVPGRALYYSMVAFLEHDNELFITNIVASIEIALGIAIGIMLANIFNTSFLMEKKKIVKRVERKE